VSKETCKVRANSTIENVECRLKVIHKLPASERSNVAANEHADEKAATRTPDICCRAPAGVIPPNTEDELSLDTALPTPTQRAEIA
jgi:hypothetical protein